MKAYINNISYNFNEGETILEFVRRIENNKNTIPTMCQDDRLENFGSCRVCSVEVAREKNGPTKTMASCHTPISEGLYIYPNTDKIKRLRKNIVELVLTDYPSDKIFPSKNKKATPFQETIAQIGIPNVRYPKGVNHLDIQPDRAHPYIKADLSQCINCFRCVRACEEIQGEMILGMSGRGFATNIIKGFDTTFNESACVSCGACVQTCPTEALTDKFETKTLIADKTVRTTCTYCGVGCQLDVSVIDGEIRGIQAPETAEVNQGHTCLKGRFAFQFYNHPDRLREPMIKKNGKFEEVSWEEAYKFISSKLIKIKNKYGADAIGGISSSRATNEENYLMQKMIRVAVGTNNIDGCARVCHAPTAFGMQQSFGTGAATNSIEDLKQTDAIFLFGANPVKGHPVTGAKIKQAFMKGVTSIVVDPIKTKLAELADYHLQIRPGTNVAILNMIAHYIVKEGLVNQHFIDSYTEKYQEFKEHVENLDMNELETLTGVSKELVKSAAIAYASANNAMEFHGLGVTEHFQGSKTVMLLSNLAMMTGNVGRKGVGLNPLRGQNNVQGTCDMGMLPYYDPDYQVPKEIGLMTPQLVDEMLEDRVKAVLNIGEDLTHIHPNLNKVDKAFDKLEMIFVQELFMTDIANRADIVVGVKSAYEKTGVYINAMRRLHLSQPLVKSDLPDDWEVLQILDNKMGGTANYESSKDVWDEVREVAYRRFSGADYIRLERHRKRGLQWPVHTEDTPILHQLDFRTDDGLGRFVYHQYKLRGMIEEIINKNLSGYHLTTGRTLAHYNNAAQTKRSEKLNSKYDEDILLVYEEDSADFTSDKVILKTEFGQTNPLTIKFTNKVQPKTLFATFHHAGSKINNLFGDKSDELILTAAFKSIKVEVINC
jgi:formate dehydrogenase major subunit